MSQLLVCTMNLPAFAVSGSFTVDCAQSVVHAAGIVVSLNTVNVPGALLLKGLVCGPRSRATLDAVACGPTGGLGSPASIFMPRARAARCALVGTNGLLLVAARTKRPDATCPVFAAALCVPAGAVLNASPVAAPRSPATSADAVAAAASTYHRRLAQLRSTPMCKLPFWRSQRHAGPLFLGPRLTTVGAV